MQVKVLPLTLLTNFGGINMMWNNIPYEMNEEVKRTLNNILTDLHNKCSGVVECFLPAHNFSGMEMVGDVLTMRVFVEDADFETAMEIADECLLTCVPFDVSRKVHRVEEGGYSFAI